MSEGLLGEVDGAFVGGKLGHKGEKMLEYPCSSAEVLGGILDTLATEVHIAADPCHADGIVVQG